MTDPSQPAAVPIAVTTPTAPATSFVGQLAQAAPATTSSGSGLPWWKRMETLFLIAGMLTLGLIAVLTINGDVVDNNWWVAAGGLLVASGVVYNPSRV